MVSILFPLLPAVIFHFLYSRLGRFLRGAEAPLFQGGVGFAVCLKAYPDTNPLVTAVKIKVKSKINVQGNGQSLP
jgi:hypothetical protein